MGTEETFLKVRVITHWDELSRGSGAVSSSWSFPTEMGGFSREALLKHN